MSSWDRKVRMEIGAASLEIPETLASRGQGIDSDSRFLEGPEMSIVIDQGPFSDPLTSHVGRPDYRETSEEIAGLPARTIFYRDPDEGSYTVAAHIPALNRLTVVVKANVSVPRQVADDVIQSIRRAGSTDRKEE